LTLAEFFLSVTFWSNNVLNFLDVTPKIFSSSYQMEQILTRFGLNVSVTRVPAFTFYYGYLEERSAPGGAS
jgi:hypothetical protein